ncbi:outer membrane protein [Xanthomonas arboricola]
MIKPLCFALLSVAAFPCLAQASADEDFSPPGPPRWSIGAAAIVQNNGYAGEGTNVQPIPLVTFEGERFYFRGITAGWRAFASDAFELDVIGKFRFDGFAVDDLGRKQLASNGVDITLLEDRDSAIDLGVAMKWSGEFGQIDLELLADATDTSGGQEATLKYGYPFQVGKGTLTPNIGATWRSKDNANYYYGTLDSEIARGVVSYKPGAVTMGQVGVDYFRPIGEKWALLAFATYSALPDEIKNSPLVEADTDSTMQVFVGFTRGF